MWKQSGKPRGDVIQADCDLSMLFDNVRVTTKL